MTAEVDIRVKATDDASNVFQKIGNSFGGMMQTAGGFLMANVIQQGASAIMGFAQQSISAASNLAETYNKVGAIFEEGSQDIIDWSKNAATAVGLSSQQAMDGASTMAVFGKAAGLAGADLNKFATENVQLAADLASFFNSSVPEAVEALGAAFRGEAEPLRRYGILLNDDMMRAKALEMGIISTTKNALTPQQKTLAANALIWEQTADAQGDFARTADGLANSQRILTAQIENAKTELGTAFLPIVTKVVGLLNTQGIPVLLNFIDAFKYVFEAFASGESISGFFSTFEDGSNRIGGILQMFGMAEEQAYAMGEAFNQSMQPVIAIIDAVQLGFQNLFGALQVFWMTNGAPIMENVRKMGDAFSAMVNKIVADIGPLINEVFGKISLWVIENGPLIQETFAAISTVVTETLVPAIMVAWEVIKPILLGLVDLILGTVRLAMQLFTGDWQGAWETIKTTLTNVGNYLIQAVTNLLYGIVALFGGNLDTILDNVAKWIVDIILKFRELRDKIVEQVDNFLDAGRAIVDGIWQGIEDGWGALVGWFEDKLSELASAAANVFDIGSPSRVFADIGMNLMTGLTRGIEAGSSTSVRAITTAMLGLTEIANRPIMATANVLAGVGELKTVETAGIKYGDRPMSSPGSNGSIVVNVNVSSPITFLDDANAVENIRKYVMTAVRQLKAEGAIK